MYSGAEILPWEDPHLNYRTLADLRSAPPERDALKYIPPGY